MFGRILRPAIRLLFTTLILAVPVGSRAEDPAQTAGRQAQAHRTALAEIREQAASMPIDLRKDIDKRIAATVEHVNHDVESTGQARIAAKLAPGLGLTTEALLDAKREHGFSWGELVVARTLLSDSKRAIDLADLGTLREEGWSWGALAFALGFHLEDLEDQIRTQGRIAAGLSKK